MRVAPEIVLTNEEHAELSKRARSKLSSVRIAQRARIVRGFKVSRDPQLVE